MSGAPVLPSEVEGRTLPAALRRLFHALTGASWHVRASSGHDTADHLFVTLEASSPGRDRKVAATWHTRATGGRTLRLFSCMLHEPYRGWRHLSVAALIADIASPSE